MSARPATTAACLAAILSAAAAVPREGEPVFAEKLLFDKLNRERRAGGIPALHWDTPSHPVARAVAADFLQGREWEAKTTYRAVALRRGVDLAEAYQCWRAADREGAFEEARTASYLSDPRYTHASVAVAEGEGVRGATAAVVLFLASVPPRFGRAVANTPARSYLFRCPSCGKEEVYAYREPRGFGFNCENCGTFMYAYLDDMEGINRWASWYITPYSPDRVSNPFLAWAWANERIRYDHEKLRHNLPGWQPPALTHRLGTGVCRDTAVLLAAWLRNMGVDARAVSGLHETSHHAWVVMFEGETAYLLETAIDARMNRRYPPRLELATDYYPTRMMWNDTRVWVNRGQQRVRDYSSPTVWLEIKEAP